jgi:hypothetical protein
MYIKLVDCEPDHVLVSVDAETSVPDVLTAIREAVAAVGRTVQSVYFECLEDGYRQYVLQDGVPTEDVLLTAGHLSGNVDRYHHVWWFATTHATP